MSVPQSIQRAEIVEAKASGPAYAPAVPSESGAILSMIERASRDPSVDIEKFERLMAMRERMEMRTAQIAFAAAVSEAKAKIEPITRNAKGHNEKRYADFSAIANAVDSILSASGLSYRFRSSQTEKSVSVTCILSHRDGHSEETTLTSAPDSSGSKNSIQAIGSALTYLQRYSLTLSLGLATTNDDDGRKAGVGETISPDQYADLLALAEKVGANDADEARMLRALKVEDLHMIPAAKFDQAMTILRQKGARQ